MTLYKNTPSIIITIQNHTYPYHSNTKSHFHIIRMPDKNGNIPLHVFYGSIMSEFLWIARATLLFSDFLPRAKTLFERMIKQGGEKSRVLAQIQRAMHRHPKPFIKFALTSQQIITSITGNEFH